MKKTRVAINGFGRIGRTLLRVLIHRDDIEVVAINDLADAQTMAHLFRYDSIHGKWRGEVKSTEDSIVVNDQRILFFRMDDPEQLPWNKLAIDIVIECTGMFRSRESAGRHLKAGAHKVILSAPPNTDDIPMVVMGVNDSLIDWAAPVLSCASCTTNSAAPMIQLLDELCGIESCYITTVHSYTGDQCLHDAPHKDLRRGRAAAESIVPTSTGAAKALTSVFPHLANSMGGCGIRVPVPDGSLTDITAIVHHTIKVETLNQAFRDAARNRYRGILEYADAPLVSRDIIGNPHSCVFDAPLTSVIGRMVKIVGWYDNEFGYSNRLADVIQAASAHNS